MWRELGQPEHSNDLVGSANVAVASPAWINNQRLRVEKQGYAESLISDMFDEWTIEAVFTWRSDSLNGLQYPKVWEFGTSDWNIYLSTYNEKGSIEARVKGSDLFCGLATINGEPSGSWPEEANGEYILITNVAETPQTWERKMPDNSSYTMERTTNVDGSCCRLRNPKHNVNGIDSALLVPDATFNCSDALYNYVVFDTSNGQLDMDNDLTHIAVSANSNAMFMYVNGLYAGTSQIPLMSFRSVSHWTIGRSVLPVSSLNPTGDAYFSGDIYGIAVHNSSLGPQDFVFNIMNTFAPTDEPTVMPSVSPVVPPTTQPSFEPSDFPTPHPVTTTTSEPTTSEPTLMPASTTAGPTEEPSFYPSAYVDPNGMNAFLSDDGLYITVIFPTDTSTPESPDCSVIVQNYLDYGTLFERCFWTDKRTLILQLGRVPRPTFLDENLLFYSDATSGYVYESIIWDDMFTYHPAAWDSAPIRYNPVRTSVAITGPTRVSRCQAIQFTTTPTSVMGRWLADAAFAFDRFQTEWTGTALNDSSLTDTYTIEASRLSAGEYTLELLANNAWTPYVDATTTSHTFSVEDGEMPTVTLLSGVSGVYVIDVTKRNTIYARIEALGSACSQADQPLTVQWTQITDMAVISQILSAEFPQYYSGVSVANLEISSANDYLYIPPFRLTQSHYYVFKLRACQGGCAERHILLDTFPRPVPRPFTGKDLGNEENAVISIEDVFDLRAALSTDVVDLYHIVWVCTESYEDGQVTVAYRVCDLFNDQALIEFETTENRVYNVEVSLTSKQWGSTIKGEIQVNKRDKNVPPTQFLRADFNPTGWPGYRLETNTYSNLTLLDPTREYAYRFLCNQSEQDIRSAAAEDLNTYTVSYESTNATFLAGVVTPFADAILRPGLVAECYLQIRQTTIEESQYNSEIEWFNLQSETSTSFVRVPMHHLPQGGYCESTAPASAISPASYHIYGWDVSGPEVLLSIVMPQRHTTRTNAHVYLTAARAYPYTSASVLSTQHPRTLVRVGDDLAYLDLPLATCTVAASSRRRLQLSANDVTALIAEYTVEIAIYNIVQDIVAIVDSFYSLDVVSQGDLTAATLLNRLTTLVNAHSDNWDLLVPLAQTAEYVSGLQSSSEIVAQTYAGEFQTFVNHFYTVMDVLSTPFYDEHDEIPGFDEVAFQKIAYPLIGVIASLLDRSSLTITPFVTIEHVTGTLIPQLSRLSAEGHYPGEVGIKFLDRIIVISQLFTAAGISALDCPSVQFPSDHAMGLLDSRRYLMTCTEFNGTVPRLGEISAYSNVVVLQIEEFYSRSDYAAAAATLDECHPLRVQLRHLEGVTLDADASSDSFPKCEMIEFGLFSDPSFNKSSPWHQCIVEESNAEYTTCACNRSASWNEFYFVFRLQVESFQANPLIEERHYFDSEESDEAWFWVIFVYCLVVFLFILLICCLPWNPLWDVPLIRRTDVLLSETSRVLQLQKTDFKREYDFIDDGENDCLTCVRIFISRMRNYHVCLGLCLRNLGLNYRPPERFGAILACICFTMGWTCVYYANEEEPPIGEIVFICIMAFLLIFINLAIRLLFSKTRPGYAFRDYIYEKQRIMTWELLLSDKKEAYISNDEAGQLFRSFQTSRSAQYNMLQNQNRSRYDYNASVFQDAGRYRGGNFNVWADWVRLVPVKDIFQELKYESKTRIDQEAAIHMLARFREYHPQQISQNDPAIGILLGLTYDELKARLSDLPGPECEALWEGPLEEMQMQERLVSLKQGEPSISAGHGTASPSNPTQPSSSARRVISSHPRDSYQRAELPSDNMEIGLEQQVGYHLEDIYEEVNRAVNLKDIFLRVDVIDVETARFILAAVRGVSYDSISYQDRGIEALRGLSYPYLARILRICPPDFIDSLYGGRVRSDEVETNRRHARSNGVQHTYRINYWIEFTQGDPDSSFHGLDPALFDWPITRETAREILVMIRQCAPDRVSFADPGIKYFVNVPDAFTLANQLENLDVWQYYEIKFGEDADDVVTVTTPSSSSGGRKNLSKDDSIDMGILGVIKDAFGHYGKAEHKQKPAHTQNLSSSTMSMSMNTYTTDTSFHTPRGQPQNFGVHKRKANSVGSNSTRSTNSELKRVPFGKRRFPGPSPGAMEFPLPQRAPGRAPAPALLEMDQPRPQPVRTPVLEIEMSVPRTVEERTECSIEERTEASSVYDPGSPQEAKLITSDSIHKMNHKSWETCQQVVIRKEYPIRAYCRCFGWFVVLLFVIVGFLLCWIFADEFNVQVSQSVHPDSFAKLTLGDDCPGGAVSLKDRLSHSVALNNTRDFDDPLLYNSAESVL